MDSFRKNRYVRSAATGSDRDAFFENVASSSLSGKLAPSPMFLNHMRRTLCICPMIAGIVRPLPAGGCAFHASSAKFSIRYALMRSLALRIEP